MNTQRAPLSRLGGPPETWCVVETIMRRPRRIVTVFLGLVGAGFTILVLDFALSRCCGIPPRDSTRTTMWSIKRRILRYAHENGSLPTTLENLPEIPGHANKTRDWWGNPIRFEVDAGGIVTLSSDGGRSWGYKPQQGAPLVCRFRPKKANGEWSDELVDFIRDADDK
jgi:hypothetical protein